jgi:hypothetical protein
MTSERTINFVGIIVTLIAIVGRLVSYVEPSLTPIAVVGILSCVAVFLLLVGFVKLLEYFNMIAKSSAEAKVEATVQEPPLAQPLAIVESREPPRQQSLKQPSPPRPRSSTKSVPSIRPAAWRPKPPVVLDFDSGAAPFRRKGAKDRRSRSESYLRRARNSAISRHTSSFSITTEVGVQ